MKPIETDRLIIRPFEMQDLEPIHEAVWGDPAVAGPFAGKAGSLEETRLWLITCINRAHAPGYCAVVRKDRQTLIGFFTLSVHLAHYLRLEGEEGSKHNSLEVELGYAIGKAHQRQGFATEAGTALIQYAFEDLKIKRLISGGDPRTNPASHNLARKLGFQMVRNLHPRWPGMVGVLYNPSWVTPPAGPAHE